MSDFTHKLLNEVEGTGEPVEGGQTSTSKQVEPHGSVQDSPTAEYLERVKAFSVALSDFSNYMQSLPPSRTDYPGRRPINTALFALEKAIGSSGYGTDTSLQNQPNLTKARPYWRRRTV